jgi:hypothetical protein
MTRHVIKCCAQGCSEQQVVDAGEGYENSFAAAKRVGYTTFLTSGATSQHLCPIHGNRLKELIDRVMDMLGTNETRSMSLYLVVQDVLADRARHESP